MSAGEFLLSVENLSVSFKNNKKNIIQRVVNDVCFQIKRVKRLGLLENRDAAKRHLEEPLSGYRKKIAEK